MNKNSEHTFLFPYEAAVCNIQAYVSLTGRILPGKDFFFK